MHRKADKKNATKLGCTKLGCTKLGWPKHAWPKHGCVVRLNLTTEFPLECVNVKRFDDGPCCNGHHRKSQLMLGFLWLTMSHELAIFVINNPNKLADRYPLHTSVYRSS